jgi:hypothetical protein
VNFSKVVVLNYPNGGIQTVDSQQTFSMKEIEQKDMYEQFCPISERKIPLGDVGKWLDEQFGKNYFSKPK